MEKSIKIIILGFILAINAFAAKAQTELYICGQFSKPYSLTRDINFSDRSGKGLYARNGGGFTMEINTRKMFGVGGLFSYSGFGVDFDELAKDLRAISIEKSGIVGLYPIWFWSCGQPTPYCRQSVSSAKKLRGF